MTPDETKPVASTNRARASKLTKMPAQFKRTDLATQLRKLPVLLRHGPRNTYELRTAGISHPSGRVRDLEALGYVFQSDRITTVDAHGFTHVGVALYTLISEPLGEGHE